MGKEKRVELLAPAGNAEGFYGAVHAGADAVYLAGEYFGARAYAENFTTEKLLECIRYAHLLNRKIYLAVNTLVKESELPRLLDYLTPFYEAGLDAVIVQDPGVLRLIRQYFPRLKIHASTQMTICSGYGASLLKRMGVSRIVPARELSLEEVRSMREKAGIEIETFIHGAMCYCYSGQCLFSSILGGRSGNRGRCAQPCRLPYSVQAGEAAVKNCYPLSLKDLCTITRIPQLVEAGIDSFKIEGRMKRPEYTAGVTAVYRRYVDTYYELREKKGPAGAAEAYQVTPEDLSLLSSLYIRSDISEGYYFRRNGRDMVTMASPSYQKSDPKGLAEIHENYISRRQKLLVDIKASFHVGAPVLVCFTCRESSYCVTGGMAECAAKQPITSENIRKQLGKLGDSIFTAANVEIEVDSNCFYPLKEINELRRTAAAGLEKVLFSRENVPNRGPVERLFPSEEGRGVESEAERTVCNAIGITTLPQLKTIAEWLLKNRMKGPFRFYIDGDLFLEKTEKVLSLCGRLPEYSVLFIVLPYILRLSDEAYMENLYFKTIESGIFQGFLVRSMDGLGFLKEKNCQLSCRSDAGLYIWNRQAGKELAELVDGYCLPYELRRGEQNSLVRGLSWEKVVYGRIPMMISANCLYRTLGRCTAEKHRPQKPAILKDRFGKTFPAAANCLHCMNVIYNSVPLSLHKELSHWRKAADLRLDFTLETPEEIPGILDCFMNGAPFPKTEYTTGHEKRGVE